MAKPSLERLQEALDYEPVTGLVFWKSQTGRRAGHRHINGNVVVVDGMRLLVRHIAWLFIHGEWPPQNVTTRNKDRYDDRAENLLLDSRDKQWTDGRDAKLRELWAAGTPKRQIFPLLGCGWKSLNKRIASLGLPPHQAAPVFAWTEERDNILHSSLTASNLAEIAKLIGTTRRRVRSRARELGIKLPVKNWPVEDIEKLRELWPTTMSATAIGELLGHSKNSVLGMGHRLRLGRKPGAPVQLKPRRSRTQWQPAHPRNTLAARVKRRQRDYKAEAQKKKERDAQRSGPKFRKEPTFFAMIPPAPNQRNITIDLTNAYTCLWVSDERADHPQFGNLPTYCGLPTLGNPWCPFHHAIASAPTPRMLAEAA